MLSTFNKVDKVNRTDTEYERLSDANNSPVIYTIYLLVKQFLGAVDIIASTRYAEQG